MLRIKKSYLLLEIVIAFTLFASCAIPLIQQPFGLLQKEKKMIEEIETERIAALAFAEIYLKLCQEEWSWSELEKSKENPIILNESKEEVKITKEFKFESEYSLSIKCKKKTESSLLIDLTLNFKNQTKKKKPNQFHYLIRIEKIKNLS